MSRGQFQSVLYVDDDPDICEVVAAALRSTGNLQVHVAASGEQAISLADALRPDLILMDVIMPGLDGPSTLKRMRESALIADIPVIFLTAKVLTREVADLLKLGAIGVIGKPFDPLGLHDDLVALWKNQDAAPQTTSVRGAQLREQTDANSLATSFLERARRDVGTLREMIERVRFGDRAALKEIERVAHSIHGTGAMFGFPEVSTSGGTIERLVEAAANGPVPEPAVQTALLQTLGKCTERLTQDIETASESRPSSGAMLQGRRKRPRC